MNLRSLALLTLLSPIVLPYAASQTTARTLAASAPAPVPPLIPYSGLTTRTDQTSVTFLIFKDQTGGEPLFTESQMIAPDEAGRYKVQLGAASPDGLPSDLFSSGEARWLEVQTAGQPAEPRVLLASVPYALKAADAATLGGLPASAFARAGSNSCFTNTSSPAITPDATLTVTTTGGTANKVAKFSSGNAIVNSLLYDNGTQVGINTTAPTATLTVGGTLTVNGGTTQNGDLLLAPYGMATSSTGYLSHALKLNASAYNSSTKAVVSPRFQFQTEIFGNNTSTPGGRLDLLASSGAAGIAETGLYFNTDGSIHFAPAQVFPGGPGSGTISGVTAGTGLTGGGTTGVVTLKVDTTKAPLLAANNTFVGNQTFTGNEYVSGNLGIGTATPSTVLEASVNAASALGPVLTLTNPGGDGASAAVDFKTYLHAVSAATPTVRIVATDDNDYGSSLSFLSKTPGSDSNTLQNNVVISSNGQVGIPSNSGNSQLEVTASIAGTDGITATGGAGATHSNSSDGGVGGLFLGGNGATEGGYAIEAEGGATPSGSLALAAYFSGSVVVGATLYAGNKAFKIDDPRDPANKYLVHSSIESSEMMNLYTGNAVTDELGLATVQLPEWFEAENGDFRYQLTIIGRQAQAWIAEEVSNGKFKIATNASHVKVSWQIVGVRQDAFAKANPLVPEQEKPSTEKGFYLHPELFGQPAEKQTEWGRHPQQMQRIREIREKQKLKAENTKAPVSSKE
jgi:hypothetical protein